MFFFGMTGGILKRLCMRNMVKKLYIAAISLDAIVASVLKNKEWRWKPAMSEEIVSIQSKLYSVELGDEG